MGGPVRAAPNSYAGIILGIIGSENYAGYTIYVYKPAIDYLKYKIQTLYYF